MIDETGLAEKLVVRCLYFVMTSVRWMIRALSPARQVVPIDAKRGFSPRAGSKGFTLVELLTVMAIVAIMTSVVVGTMPGIKGSSDMTKAAEDISGMLEQARTMAMAGNTYAWVGFYEENPSTPGVAGTGQVVVSIVTASDGTNLNSNGTAPTVLPYGSLLQVNRLIRISNLHLDSLTAADVPTRTTVPAASYQLANTDFANGTTFPYPLATSASYQFTQVIQFNPQGDASRIYATPVQLMEIGLRPTRGSVIETSSKDLVAVQIAGIGGKVTVYRP